LLGLRRKKKIAFVVREEGTFTRGGGRDGFS